MVINHLLTGMILQVRSNPLPQPGLRGPDTDLYGFFGCFYLSFFFRMGEIDINSWNPFVLLALPPKQGRPSNQNSQVINGFQVDIDSSLISLIWDWVELVELDEASD